MVPVIHSLLSNGVKHGAGGQPDQLAWPQDPDWLLPLGSILIVIFALGCLMLFIILRWGRCNNHDHQLGGRVSLFEHECIVASVATVALLVLSLAGFYYLYCYRGGCYFTAVDAGGPPVVVGGRKQLANMIMSR